MPGIYIHIPICKSKCYYCDFYSVVSIHKKKDLIDSVCKEIVDRKDYLRNKNIDTIYFGGGTPSLLTTDEVLYIYDSIKGQYDVNKSAEITFECNPDDLKIEYLKQLKNSTPVNRLSIGVQSFNDRNLRFLNRRHNSQNAKTAVLNAKESGFKNISIDLIYGIPGLDLDDFKEDIKNAIELDIQHVSAYHLSYEQGTPLFEQLKNKTFESLSEIESEQQYMMLVDDLKKGGYIHYEISNFAREDLYSRHNIKYWKNEEYIGLGPSAHSYNLYSRQWNISDIDKYIEYSKSGKKYFTAEKLNIYQKYNEYILTGLRTKWGISIKKIQDFGENYYNYFLKNSLRYISVHDIIQNGHQYYLTDKAMFKSNSIISDLMWVED